MTQSQSGSVMLLSAALVAMMTLISSGAAGAKACSCSSKATSEWMAKSL